MGNSSRCRILRSKSFQQIAPQPHKKSSSDRPLIQSPYAPHPGMFNHHFQIHFRHRESSSGLIASYPGGAIDHVSYLVSREVLESDDTTSVSPDRLRTSGRIRGTSVPVSYKVFTSRSLFPV